MALDANFIMDRFVDAFVGGELYACPWPQHVQEHWERRQEPHVLFLRFENVVKDLPSAIKRIAEFLNRPLSEDDVVKIADHCRVESMNKNEMVNWKYMDDIMTVNGVTKGNFINKGATGGWYDVLTSEQSAKIDAMAKELENSGFDVHRLEEKQGVNI